MIVLIGFMGAGKSTIGRKVADLLGSEFVDADEVIAGRAGMSVSEIFESGGEQMFRTLEREVIEEALLEAGEVVLALGGGALTTDEIRDQLRSHTVVLLDVTFEEAMRRVGDTERPMLRAGDASALYDRRAIGYADAASIVVRVTGRSPDDIAEEVVSRARTGRRRVRVATPDSGYEVIVGRDVLREVDVLLDPTPRRAVVLHQPSVEAYAKEVAHALSGSGTELVLLAAPDGEAAKDPDAALKLWGALAEAELNRDDALVTVGGGSVSDAGGFVASTFMRGIRVVHVPTSLLGQVDAAVGGKTALNLSYAKNLVGTIYQPRGVVCDVRTLATLPVEEMRSGCAEVLKYGFIAEPELARTVVARADDVIGADAGTLIEVVVRCVSIKADVVANDEHDTGRRKILNYGHTFAHAFEQRSNYTLRHGHAVALGMMAAALTSHELGWITEEEVSTHRDALEAFGLPVRASYELEDLRDAWKRDKKARETTRFVLLRGLGRVETDVEVAEDVLRTALARLAA